MKRSASLWIVFLMVLSLVPAAKFASALYGTKVIDGDLSDWSSQDLIAESYNIHTSMFAGADLYQLYVAWDGDYLYIAIKTNNTGSWDVAYGIGIDVDPGSGNGATTSDPWGQNVEFGGGYAVDYVLYGHWVPDKAKLKYDFDQYEGMQFIKYDPTQQWPWVYKKMEDAGVKLGYTGDTSTGLQTLEIAIPWSSLGGIPDKIAVIAWVIDWGFGGNSPVDSVPFDQAVSDSISDPNNPWDEKYDTDTFTNLAEVELIFPKPELTVSLSSNVLDVEQWQPANITIKVKNIGEVDAQNVTVHLYDGNDLLKSWVVNLSAHAEVNLTYLYTYSEAWGVHTLKAVVDPNNEIDEANEDNNVATLDIIVGQIAERQNRFIRFGMYVWPKIYPAKYAETKEMVENVSSMGLPSKYEDIIKGFELKLNESLELFNEGKSLIYTPHYELRGAMKMFSAYSRLLRLQREIKDFLESLEFKKKIDGSLSDWNETSLVAQNKAGAGAGAYLDALYVDYDDEYIYIALSTKNTESWRIAYGFAFDYKDGGYTGDTDAWGRKIGFTRGVDAEIYLYWNGPFFGEPGTNTITSAEFAIWNGTGWSYLPLFKNASVKYIGGENGLQTLEMAIPWELFGEKPEKIYIVAWITGANAGDSAVTTIPDDPSVHDSDNEWGDADVISTFAEVYIE